MKKILVTTVAAASILLVAGCASNKPINYSTDQKVPINKILLEDGRTIDCIYLNRAAADASTGGPSCDWENAK